MLYEVWIAYLCRSNSIIEDTQDDRDDKDNESQ